MHYAAKLFILVTCVAVAASLSPAQPPKGKQGDKGPKGGGLSEAALVDDIVSRLMAFDKNMDGKLTRDEITDSRLLRLFDKADTNKDGVVTREQVVTLAKQMVAESAAEGGGKGGPGGPGKFGPPDKGGKGKGPPDKGGFGGPPGQILPPFLQDMLQLTAEQKLQVDALQTEVNAKLVKILTDDQNKQLKQVQQGGPKK
jgi:hypothetical protein